MSADEEKHQGIAVEVEPAPGPPEEAPLLAQVVEQPVVQQPGVQQQQQQQQVPEDDDDDEEETKKKPGPGRRKINIEFIEDKSRRHITFSKRKAGIMKKAYELSALTGTQVLLLVASETGHVYTYATEKLQPLIQKPEGKNLIQTCLSAPDQQAQEAIQARPQTHHQPQDSTAQYAAMAAAVAAAQQAATQERPQKQRKTVPGGSPGMGYGGQLPPGMAGMAGLNPYGLGMPYGSMGVPAGQDMGRGGLPFGMDARSLPGMPGQIPGMPAGMGAAQLQGLSPALLQGLMSGQLPSPAMMGMEGGFGAGGGKLEALQQTIADATNAGRDRQ